MTISYTDLGKNVFHARFDAEAEVEVHVRRKLSKCVLELDTNENILSMKLARNLKSLVRGFDNYFFKHSLNCVIHAEAIFWWITTLRAVELFVESNNGVDV